MRPHRLAIALVAAALLSGACASTKSSGAAPASGTYTCTVTQIRNDGCNCAIPQPPGILNGAVAGTSFTMTLTGNALDVPGSFSCNGTWSGSSFDCTMTGCPFDGCASCGISCPNVPFSILPEDPTNPSSLAPGQIYAGTYQASGGLSAHCEH